MHSFRPVDGSLQFVYSLVELSVHGMHDGVVVLALVVTVNQQGTYYCRLHAVVAVLCK